MKSLFEELSLTIFVSVCFSFVNQILDLGANPFIVGVISYLLAKILIIEQKYEKFKKLANEEYK